MKLKKQLFVAFIYVAILPLMVVGIYMFVSNLMLAFELYEQNLKNSTEIQTDLVEENINRLMVRAGRFASSKAVKWACLTGPLLQLDNEDEFSTDILNFTDETLDNVAAFALIDADGNIIYSSGSNSDTQEIEAILPNIKPVQTQEIMEFVFGERGSSLLLVTPVKDDKDKSIIGNFLVVFRTDYFLRTISSHKQLEGANAFIYCKEHDCVVVSKLGFRGEPPKLLKKQLDAEQGSFVLDIAGQKEMLYYRNIAKTPWLLANTVPTKRIHSQIWNYGIINIAAMVWVILIVLYLSKRQSKRMLKPLEKLLESVEQFFISGANDFKNPALDSQTEIGYLAEKFSNMSSEISSTQGRLRESTYLYHALLQATYEFRIIINLYKDTVDCTLEVVTKQLQQPTGVSASERVLKFLLEHALHVEGNNLEDIAFGRLSKPAEIEICFNMGKHREQTWYYLVAVPITNDNNEVEKVVLHFEDVTQQKHEEFKLIRSSQTDPLCGLLNKTAFPLHCHMSEPGKTDAVFFIDLDGFKQINDSLGHAAGDEILIAAAEAIKEQFRNGDAIGRFGGDEFVVFAANMPERLAMEKAEKLVEALSFFRTTPTATLHVTASVGLCIAMRPMELLKAIQLADEAMYLAKENGKSQYCVANKQKKA